MRMRNLVAVSMVLLLAGCGAKSGEPPSSSDISDAVAKVVYEESLPVVKQDLANGEVSQSHIPIAEKYVKNQQWAIRHIEKTSAVLQSHHCSAQSGTSKPVVYNCTGVFLNKLENRKNSLQFTMEKTSGGAWKIHIVGE